MRVGLLTAAPERQARPGNVSLTWVPASDAHLILLEYV